MSATKTQNEAQRLEALRRYRILDTLPEQAFDDFVYLASLICQSPIAAISLVDSERQWFKARVGLEAAQTPREHSFCAHAILGQETMVVEDATQDPRFAQNPLVTGAPSIRFYAGAPLIDSNGYGLGSICVIDRRPRALADSERRALEALSRQIIVQMEFRRSSSELAELLANVKSLEGLLPICSHCKGIRDDEGYWQNVEAYLAAHTDADFSHGICPQCFQKHFPEVYARRMKAVA
jgi:GAF domain-containing protein